MPENIFDMADIILSRADFAALHHQIVHTCYPEADVREAREQLSDTKFYGYAPGGAMAESNEGSIAQIISKKIEPVGGKPLWQAKNYYNDQTKPVQIPDRPFRIYLEFVGLNPWTLQEWAEKFHANNPDNFPPTQIRPNTYHKTRMSPPPGNVAEINTTLVELAQTPHWFWFYEYEGSVPGAEKLARLLLQFKIEQNECLVELLNTSHAYAKFSGRVTRCTDQLLIAELSGRTKKMYLMFSISADPSEIAIGMFFKHGFSAKIYAGSVVLQRIPPGSDPLTPEIIPFDEDGPFNVPKAIRRFFANSKSYVFNKIPQIYSLSQLDTWLDMKREKRGELPLYDLFVAAPVMGMERQMNKYQRLEADIFERVRAFLQANHFDESIEVQSLRRSISELLRKEILELASDNLEDYDWRAFNDLVIRSIEAIAMAFKVPRIYYSRFVPDFDDNVYHRTPHQVLKEEFENVSRSRALMLICPHSGLFSSCWVQIGWAMMRNIPVFIVFSNREDLVLILRDAATHPNMRCFTITDWANLPEKLPKWLSRDPWWKKHFSKC